MPSLAPLSALRPQRSVVDVDARDQIAHCRSNVFLCEAAFDDRGLHHQYESASASLTAKTGSVGVMHAAMHSASRKVRPGTSALIRPAEMNHAMVMIGMSRMKSDRRACHRYALGSSICGRQALAAPAPSATHAGDENLDADDHAIDLVRELIARLDVAIRPPQRVDPAPSLRSDRNAEQQGYKRRGHEQPLLEDVADDTHHADAAPSEASSVVSRTRSRAPPTRSRPARRPRVAWRRSSVTRWSWAIASLQRSLRAERHAVAVQGREEEIAGAKSACGPLC